MKKWSAILAVLLVCSPAGLASSRNQREHGAAIFAESGCTHCHTIRNAGGHKGPDLSGVGRRLKKAQIQNQIVNGSKLMPPFGDDLRAADLDALLAYLKSCRDKKK
ncbi:MAG: cytochrome c [Terracidiphilus sp.]|jgi:mono/diheme cytochrome c family protein